MPFISILLFGLLMFIGCLMAESGLRGLWGQPDVQSFSPLLLLLARLAPHTHAKLEPILTKLDSLGWLAFGSGLIGLGVYGVWLLSVP